jgi:hypothetical protein
VIASDFSEQTSTWKCDHVPACLSLLIPPPSPFPPPLSFNLYSLMPLSKTITDLAQSAETIRRCRYGVIEVADGQFRRIVVRPFPKTASLPGSILLGGWRHRHQPGDRLRLYYNQPRRFSNFLVLKYIESARDTGFGTLSRALAVLDEIARQKGSDALLCDVSNRRITSRLLGRFGWSPHCPSRLHRHYIKRLYKD